MVLPVNGKRAIEVRRKWCAVGIVGIDQRPNQIHGSPNTTMNLQ